MAQHRPAARRAVDRGQRRQGAAERGLLRRRRRRAVEDDRRRRELDAGHRRADQELLGRRRRRVGIEPRHRLHRHGRVVHPRQHHAGRRDVQVHRRRQDLDAHRLRRRHVDAISKIRIHPTNPDIVYVAVFGKYGVHSDERGVFKTHRRRQDLEEGAVPRQQDRRGRPRDRSHATRTCIFAAMWEAYRVEYQMSSGGPGSGLFKSTDGGETWTEITRNPGLPAGVVGRIGVAVSGADSNRVYALVENERGGLYVSDNARRHVDAGQREPQHPAARVLLHARHRRSGREGHRLHAEHERVPLDRRRQDAGQRRRRHARRPSRSVDRSGRSEAPRHRQRRRRRGVDAAAPASRLDRRRTSRPRSTTTSSPRSTCPTTSAARSRTAARCACRATRTSAAAGAAAAAAAGAAAPPELYSPGGAEPGYIAPDPKNIDIFYAGGNNGSFLDAPGSPHRRTCARSTRIRAMFSGEPSSALVERWQWTYPIIFSPVDPTVLYTSSQHVWRTKNGGDNWDRISRDLTRHDPKTMGDSGGPITHDMNSPEVYGTVFALGPGKKDVNILWAGSDDGLVHVTRDGGKTWTQRHAEGHAGLRPRQPDRRLVLRARRRVRRGEEAAARRLRALHLPDARLRQDVDEDRHRHPGQRLRARRARGSGAPRPALRRHAARLLHLVRRRGSLAAAVAEPARRAGLRRLGRGELDRDRDARPQLLHPRRHRAAAAGAVRPRHGLSCSSSRPTRSAAPAPRRSRTCSRSRRRR